MLIRSRCKMEEIEQKQKRLPFLNVISKDIPLCVNHRVMLIIQPLANDCSYQLIREKWYVNLLEEMSQCHLEKKEKWNDYL